MDRPGAAASGCESAAGPGPGPGASWRPARVAGGASGSSRHPSMETLDRSNRAVPSAPQGRTWSGASSSSRPRSPHRCQAR
ncbi:rCG41272, isoform CRA_d [Rattus norvegicus]|uniref:RCG41272, isoform CRA_d n=1 Tax=Rattus norvegicus TaxID=10116 RepID=A6KNC8_RAT|nr:rCG41272, isoform CRA_d [Rattus norvegicus]